MGPKVNYKIIVKQCKIYVNFSLKKKKLWRSKFMINTFHMGLTLSYPKG